MPDLWDSNPDPVFGASEAQLGPAPGGQDDQTNEVSLQGPQRQAPLHPDRAGDRGDLLRDRRPAARTRLGGLCQVCVDWWCVGGCALWSKLRGCGGASHRPSWLWSAIAWRRSPRTCSKIVAAQGSARPWGVLPARADAGGRRKSIEPIAARLGGEVHYQALHFVAVSPWDWRPVRRRLAERLVTALEPTAWAVDDTGFPKDGTHSVGVRASTRARWARPPTASWGCRSTPSLSRPACRWTGGYSCRSPGRTTPRGGRPARCQPACGFQPKWRLVLDMLDGLERWGLRPPMLVADSGYGEVGAFGQGLDDRQVPYVVQVKADTSAYPEQVRPPQRPTPARAASPAALPR